MNKTKLGISAGLLAAAIFASGLLSSVVTVLLAGYVLLREDDAWLRRSAVKAVAIIMVFGVLSAGIDVISDVFEVVETLIRIVASSARFSVPLNLDTIVKYILGILKDLFLIGCAFQALHGGTMKVKFADNLADKNM